MKTVSSNDRVSCAAVSHVMGCAACYFQSAAGFTTAEQTAAPAPWTRLEKRGLQDNTAA